MKRINIFTIALIGSLALLSVSCEREISDDPLGLEGMPIIFSAATSYNNGVATKAEYSGQLYGETTEIERINWVDQDPIKIVYNNTPADYRVTGTITASDEKSTAGVSGGSLTWKNGPHVFYALYPNRSNGSLSVNDNVAEVSGVITANQSVSESKTITVYGQKKYQPDTENQGYMFGYKRITTPDSDNVIIPFKPAFTTFEFKLQTKSGEDPRPISSIDLTTAGETGGTDLAGGFKFTIPDDGEGELPRLPGTNNITKTGTLSRTITVDFSGLTGGSVTIPTSGYLDFSVLALPVNQKCVKVVFHYADGQSPATKTLSLKHKVEGVDTWYEFVGGKKYIITNVNVPGGEQWDYYIDEIDDVTRYGHNAITATDVFTYDVKSYKVKHGTTGPKYPVAWHLEYSTNGSSWSSTFPSTGFSALTTTTGVGYDGTTSYPAETGNSTLPDASTGSTTGGAGDATRAVLASATPRGTSSAPFDLSTHKVYGTGSTYEAKQADITNNPVDRETANCYVVQAPGVYMFPLVYGNAIKANGDNKVAYDPANCGIQAIEDLYTATNRQTLPTFRNAKNEGISGPGIVSDLSATSLSAVVVWQDAQNLILNPTVISVSGEPYQFIQFEVDANTIQQGNAIVALKGSATGLSNEILWSWHIWVTEKDLTPQRINHPQSTYSMMMKYNLGWTDKTTASSTKYPDRKIYVRAVQNEKPASESTYKSEEFVFWQKGDATSTNDNIGSNPFYQWGRKDPMVGAASDNFYKTVYYGTGYSLTTTEYNGQTVVTPSTPSSAANGQFADAIKNPHKQYFNSGNWSWIGGSTYMTNGTGSNPSTPDQTHHHDTSIPSNLWNSGVNHQAGGEAHHKTVYDPCPPGFCVPSSYAFMGMAGYTGNTAASDWNFDVNEHSSSATEGRTFSVGSSMYFPFTGARGAVHGEIYAVKATAYYWMGSITSNTYNQGHGDTEDRYGYHNSKMMYFDNSRIWPFHNLYRAACYSIRPVIE